MGRTTHSVSRAGFIADQSSIVRNDGRQIDWANVGNVFRETPGTAPVSAVVGAAGAAIGATSIPVAALSGSIPSGTTLDFGTTKLAVTTAAVAAGATAIPVRALAVALVSGDTATYAGSAGSGSKILPAGTVVGELLGAGKIGPRIATTNPATGILETTAVEGSDSAALSGFGVVIGGAVFEALLPDATGTPRVLLAAVKTELNANGSGFAFLTYSDAR